MLDLITVFALFFFPAPDAPAAPDGGGPAYETAKVVCRFSPNGAC